mmetsp:Transcript_22754/g.69591  ORF Transcript_22754/g.69591 Transcript_22754/m.69591 type:complete len:156 (-) Transcript_22754:713-1180(-)
MRVDARLSLLLILSGGAAPATSLPTFAATPAAPALAVPKLRPVICIDTSALTSSSLAPSSYSRRAAATRREVGAAKTTTIEPDIGRVYPVVWAVASLTASAWFAFAYFATAWFTPFLRLREQRSRWLRLALICSRQAFTGMPSSNLVQQMPRRTL